MKTNLGSRLRAKLRSSEMLSGPWLSIPAPPVVELMAMCSNDFLLIDGEHSPVSAKSLSTLLPCAENHDKPVIYRVPSFSSVEIKFALDAGVSGVMAPMIETAEQAEAVVASCRYAPQGDRGIGPWRASAYYRNFAGYLAEANQSTTLVLQIESRLGVANLDAIAAVKGFDVLYVGPSDLASSLGLPGTELGEEMRAILQNICAAGLAQGKTMGIDVHSVAQIPALQAMGFSFFTVGSDMEFISRGADALSKQLSQLNAGGADQLNTVDKIKDIVGNSGWVEGEHLLERSVDFWNNTPTLALGLVRPTNTQQLADILVLCNSVGQPVIVEGGRTNLVSATHGDASTLLISLERFNHIGEPDSQGLIIEVGAGAIIENIQQTCSASALRFGLDFGARGSATIGGALSTNAGGFQALRYGVARDQVLGLEAVLADGSVLSHLTCYSKDNTGYDLKHLFIGSEGTLGVITRAIIKLHPQPTSTNTALLAFETYEQVIEALAVLRRSLNGGLSAYELMWREFFEFNVDALLQGRAPLSTEYPYYALCEVEGFLPETDAETFEAIVHELFEQNLVVDAVIANSQRQRAELWRIREEFEEEIKVFTSMVDFDVSLPLKKIGTFSEQVRSTLDARFPENLGLHVLAHLGDGNVHVTTGLPEAQRRGELKDCVYQIIAENGGSISAEHGIGLAKKDHLHYSRTASELATMKLMKKALDPNNILNPGKVITL